MLHRQQTCVDCARGGGRPPTLFAQRLAVVLWSACFLAHAGSPGTAAADVAPDIEMLGVQLLSPRPNTWPDFCVDQHRNVELDVRLLVSGAQLIADQITLKLLLDGKLHTLIAVAQDAAVRAAIRAQAPFGWPARVTLFLPDRQYQQRSGHMTIEEFRKGHHQQRRVEVRLMVGDGDLVGDGMREGVEISTGEGEFFVSADDERCAGDEDAVSSGPRWRLPVSGSHLCANSVAFQPTGVSQALLRYPNQLQAHFFLDSKPVSIELEPEVDGKWPPVHLLPVALTHVEWHTVSMELINTTSYPEVFIVYQHVVAFRVTNDYPCVTWQDSLRSSHPLRRRRQVALEAHQWRQTLRLLDALTGKCI